MDDLPDTAASMEGLPDTAAASMPAYEAPTPPEPVRSNAATPNTTTSRRRGGTMCRKAAKRTSPWMLEPAAAALLHSPSEAEDISVPVAKKQRLELPLPATTEESATKITLPEAEKCMLPLVDAAPETARTLNASAAGCPSFKSTLENVVELISVGNPLVKPIIPMINNADKESRKEEASAGKPLVKPIIPMRNNADKESRKEEVTAAFSAVTLAQASIDMQRRTHSGGSGRQLSIDQQVAGLVGPPPQQHQQEQHQPVYPRRKPPTSSYTLLNIPTKFNNVKNVKPFFTLLRPAEMPAGYIPSEFDVCAGRGKTNWNLTGNINFRNMVHASVARYVAASRRNHKTAVVVSIVDEIRRQGGHFFKEQRPNSTGVWYDIGDVAAREKVGHSIRDQVNNHASAARLQLIQQADERRRAAHAARTW
jgi:hypothetical protein